MVSALALLLVAAGTWLNAFGSVFLKSGAPGFNFNLLLQLKNKNLMFGSGLFLSSTLLYLYALRLDSLSVIYPLTSLTYIWVTLLSWKKLGEKINASKAAGVVLIIIGIFLISIF
jgi:uncharacterized membrane protein